MDAPQLPKVPLETVQAALTPFADMTAEQAVASSFWPIVDFGISTNEKGDLKVRTILAPLDLSLIMSAEVRASYLVHNSSVHQRVIDSFSTDILELLAVMKFKLAMRLDQKA